MNKIIKCASALLIGLTALTSCDDAEEGIVYKETPFAVGNVRWDNSVTPSQQEVISNLLNNMVKVEACQFRMGLQSKSSKRYNYFPYTSLSRDTVYEAKDKTLAYHVTYTTEYDELAQAYRKDTSWYAAGAFHFVDTIKLKKDTIPYTVVYKMEGTNGCWVGPVTTVSMPDYYIGKFEITQEEWEAVMDTPPHGHYYLYPQEPVSQDSAWYTYFGRGGKVAAYNIWYEDAVAFCKALSAKTNLDFRLPTEAEWECAARGGKYSRGYRYPGSDDYSEAGWVRINSFNYGIGSSPYGVHKGGQKLPNELGIYDMAGNVSEWVANTYYKYSALDSINPQGNAVMYNGQDTLILRGGSWMDNKSVYYGPAVRKKAVVSSYNAYVDDDKTVLDEAETDHKKQSAFVNCGFRICISAQ